MQRLATVKDFVATDFFYMRYMISLSAETPLKLSASPLYRIWNIQLNHPQIFMKNSLIWPMLYIIIINWTHVAPKSDGMGHTVSLGPAVLYICTRDHVPGFKSLVPFQLHKKSTESVSLDFVSGFRSDAPICPHSQGITLNSVKLKFCR